jgi:hypothetical protein
MSLRIYASIHAATAAIAVLMLAPSPAAAQVAAKPAAKTAKPWTPPRTPDGHPDLQGYWTNGTFTPLERPAELAGKEFYTEAEAAEFDRQRLARENSQSKDDIHYDNALWQTEPWGRVSNRRTSLIFDPPDGRIPPLTAKGKILAAAQAEAARRRVAAESAQARSLAERCISWGNEGPPMLGSTYNANLQILQNSGQVVVGHEIIHGYRVIPLDGRPHLLPSIRQLGGDSRGRWEGGTLVVDTTNFTDKTNFRGPPATARQDIFSNEDLHVVERLTLTDADTVVYRFTVEDPTVWTKPWSGELLMKRTKGPIYEYACHEGNYGLANILAGARAAEKASAKTASQGSR